MTEAPRAADRRLVAILHADVVGYSAAMSADEAGTRAALATAMARARETVAAHHGRVVGTAGDAFLAEFASVVEAVAAAVAFQRSGGSAGDESSLRFRIGVNLGDVVVEDDDILGDGVNVAARIQALAPPGGVAISAAVRDQLRGRLDVDFADGGAHRLKNIPDPVRIWVARPPFRRVASMATSRRRPYRLLRLAAAAVAAVGLVAGAIAFFHPFGPTPDVPIATRQEARPIVAVLPFADPTAAPDEAYFADGVTQDVIAQLGRFPELLVLSWNAVLAAGGRSADLGALKARYVLGGSIRRGDDALRVAVQLADAPSGVLIWSESYDATMADLFAVQDRIAGAVAGSLATGVARIEQRRVLALPADTLEAYDLVLRGRAHAARVDRGTNYEARALFAAAKNKDPSYADAYAGLAWTHLADVLWGWSEWPAESLRIAAAEAERALALDRRNIRAMTVRSQVWFLEGRLTPALETCMRALEINPNDADAQATCGGVLVFSGEPEEGVPHLELALKIDPDQIIRTRSNLALGYYFLGRYEAATRVLGHGIRSLDEDPSPHAVLAAANARLGRSDAARREVETTLRLYPFFDAVVFAANLGDESYSQTLLEGLREAGFE